MLQQRIHANCQKVFVPGGSAGHGLSRFAIKLLLSASPVRVPVPGAAELLGFPYRAERVRYLGQQQLPPASKALCPVRLDGSIPYPVRSRRQTIFHWDCVVWTSIWMTGLSHGFAAGLRLRDLSMRHRYVYLLRPACLY